MKNSPKWLVGMLLSFALLLSACSGTAQTDAPSDEAAPTAESTAAESTEEAASETAAPEPTEEAKPTEEEKAPRGETITVTDVAGREVTIPGNVERMVFGESRLVYASVLTNKDNPVEGVVAWGKDLQSNAPDIYANLLKVAPDAEKIPTIGSAYKGDIDIEALVALEPQVYFLSLDAYEAGQENGFIEKIEAVELPYLVTDFRQDPVANTEKTVEMLGQVTNREAEATAFLDYYKSVVEPVVEKGKEVVGDAPTGFIWRAPGLLPCCGTFSDSNFAKILVSAGGKNLADTVLPGDDGALTTEALIKEQPAYVISTGGDWSEKKLNDEADVSYLPLGYTIDKETAVKGLKALTEQPGFSELNAVKENKFYGVYHQLYDSPWNFAAYQQFAKWSNPEAFADVDVDATWAEFHEKFLPWEPTGTFFSSLDS